MDTTTSRQRLIKEQHQGNFAYRFTPRKLGMIAFALAIISLLGYGYSIRDDSNLSAADGTGYLFGILGGSFMLLLMFYPLRKKLRFMHHWGLVKHWFRMHMLLGILGPVFILFHSNFSLGSTNSNLALTAMLLVAGSGLVGRYIYQKIHFGLYGHRATLKELRNDLQISKGNLGSYVSPPAKVVHMLENFEKRMLKQHLFIINFILLPVMFFYARWVHFRVRSGLKKSLREQARNNNWGKDMLRELNHDTLILFNEYFYCLKKTSQLGMYARLFSIWHILHLPLFIILIITGIIHVIAVHMY